MRTKSFANFSVKWNNLFKCGRVLMVVFFLSVYVGELHSAAYKTFNFSTLNLTDGLSQLSVLDICQDVKGYMWFATRNGLNRFDGEQFKVYKHSNYDVNTLSDNYISKLLPDRIRGGVWVATNNGLNYVDLGTDSITRYLSDSYPILRSNSILSLCMGSDGILWIGTRRGLYRLWPEERKLAEVSLDGWGKEAVTALYQDTGGRVYVGTNGKVLVCGSNGRLVQKVDENCFPTWSESMVNCIFEDSRHQLWIGGKEGLKQWSADRKSLIAYSRANGKLKEDDIRCICELDGQLIIGTFNGLSVLNLADNSMVKSNRHEAGRNGLSHFSVRSLWVDTVGTLWVGSYSGGVNYYNALDNKFIYYRPLSEKIPKQYHVFGSMGYADGKLWIATEGGGLLQFDPVTHESSNYLLDNHSEEAYNRNIIKSLLVEKQDIWCGTNNGELYCFHIPTKTFSLKYRFRDDKLGIHVIHRDEEGNFWLGTTARKGLVKLVGKGEVIRQFPVGDERHSINFSSVRAILPLDKGVYLIGTRSFGLYEYDTVKKRVRRYWTGAGKTSQQLGSNFVTDILKRKNGEIWVATFGSGIYRFLEEKGLVTHIGLKEGLSSEEIYALVDGGKALWASVDKGIAEVNPLSGQVRMHDCFAGSETLEFTPQGRIALSDGTVYFSANNAFLSFNPGTLGKNGMRPPVVLTQLTVNNVAVVPSEANGLLTKTLDDTKKLTLSFRQNNFSIAYCALNYIQHGLNRYAYKLEGHDEEWNDVGHRKVAYYTNIAPGTYTFRVRASNNDGVWNMDGRSVEIVILAPWWRTVWAYLVYVLLVVGITYVVAYYRYSKHKLELNLRMRQVEKQRLEELHQEKVRLFTNFSHELRTPLTLIISPVEELVHQAEVPLFVKRQLERVLRNAHRLLLLVNQLMDLQKKESGMLSLHLSSGDLNAFLREIFYTFKQIAENKQITFRYEAPQEEVWMGFDKNLLEKAVFNLLSNAFKFTPSGETVLLRLETVRKESATFFHIQVSDTGKGIPTEEFDRIFAPFYQVDGGALSEECCNGSGIGLNLTQSIAQLHQGTIWVEANHPKGVVFTIELPENKPDAIPVMDMKESEVSEMSIDTNKEAIPYVEGKTVLLVEDNEDIRTYLKEQLQRCYKTLEAANGTEAFALVQKELPDLVVTDIMMPGMDGLELCAAIKNDLQTGHIPIILLTARSMVMHVKEGYLSGADDYVVKPFRMDVLMVRIGNLLKQRDKLKSLFGKNFSLQSMGIGTVSSADDKFMQKLFGIIEKHLADPELNIDLLCNELGFSRSNFYRKIKAVVDMSPNDLIRYKRLEVAAQMLKETDKNVTEISMVTGFGSLAYFTKSFKAVYGVSPTEYIKKQSADSSTVEN